jgi:ABC-2 type transport system ATP-binding protein
MASIQFQNVSVDIPVYDANSRSFKNNVIATATGGKIQPSGGTRRVVVRALSDLSFTFEHGTRVGLIGHNGAGKSTMLRVIAGILEPTAGHIRIDGEVTAMLDISFGMDPEGSGGDGVGKYYSARYATRL